MPCYFVHFLHVSCFSFSFFTFLPFIFKLFIFLTFDFLLLTLTSTSTLSLTFFSIYILPFYHLFIIFLTCLLFYFLLLLFFFSVLRVFTCFYFSLFYIVTCLLVCFFTCLLFLLVYFFYCCTCIALPVDWVLLNEQSTRTPLCASSTAVSACVSVRACARTHRYTAQLCGSEVGVWSTACLPCDGAVVPDPPGVYFCPALSPWWCPGLYSQFPHSVRIRSCVSRLLVELWVAFTSAKE